MSKKSLVVAITGGMGCGQTTVSEMMKKWGAKVIHADFEAKKVIDRNMEVRKELRKVFGSKIFFRNGRLNRKLLGFMAFSDASKTNRLNEIVHPHMISRIVDIVEQARGSGRYRIIVVDAALIYELNFEHMFDAVVVVSSQMKNRIERIVQRDKLSEQAISERMDKQIPLKDKVRWADFVIHNDGDLRKLEENTRLVFKKLQGLAATKKRAAV